MNDAALSDLAAAREVVVVTSTFGDGGPPDNGADFWDRLESPDAPALDGVRYAVLGIGDRSYDNFCGHAKSLDARLADLGASKMMDRAECEVYDDEPMSDWAERLTALIRETDRPPPTRTSPAVSRTSAAAEPFTRAARCPRRWAATFGSRRRIGKRGAAVRV